MSIKTITNSVSVAHRVCPITGWFYKEQVTQFLSMSIYVSVYTRKKEVKKKYTGEQCACCLLITLFFDISATLIFQNDLLLVASVLCWKIFLQFWQ